jgi:putative hydrolase of the HAD superfamily
VIRVVWTDFGGVLTPPADQDLARVAAAAGLSPEVLLGAMRRVAAADGRQLLETLELGLVTEREWGRRVAAELAPTVPRIDLGAFGEHWYAGREFNRSLYDALVALRADGLRLGMLTNSVSEWEVHRARLVPDESVFDRIIGSHRVGVRKPEAEIYRLAERAFDAAPAECLLIDDLEVNCAAAVARGWTAIHHVDNATTLEQVRAILH